MEKDQTESIQFLRNSIDSDFNIDGSSTDHSNPVELVARYHTVQINFNRLMGHFIGNPKIDPVLYSKENEEDFGAKVVEVRSELHNYFSSVYSYHEHLRSALDRINEGQNIGRNDFIFESNSRYRSRYSKKLELIWGRRVIAQHGEYEGISTNEESSNIDGITYGRVVLDVNKFKSYNWERDNEPDKFLRQINPSEKINLIRYIAVFNEHMEEFNSASMHVINGDFETPTSDEPRAWSSIKERLFDDNQIS